MRTCGTPHMADITALRVGVVYWQENDGIASEVSRSLEKLGIETIDFLHDARLPSGLDVVIARGPFDSLVPLANQLLACPGSQRPSFVLWMTEQFPNPNLPEWVRYWGGRLRSRAERLAFRQEAPGEWRVNPRWRWLTTKAHRFRYYGDLYWLQRQGILSVLPVGSPVKIEFLRARGFDPFVIPGIFQYEWGADLKLERDIPVLWLGKIATARRRRLLQQVRTELRERGVEILMIDGVENPYIFGEERTILLNRTKIVLNLLRESWDSNSMRYALAAPNRALIVTEPTLPHTPFMPGEHLVEVPIEKMADTICHYLSHEEDRGRIVEQAYQLITKVSKEDVVAKILEQVVVTRQKAI
jgi:hypothetical protein